MADIVSSEKRSSMMSGIRSKDTGLEMLLRRGLHRAGFRFRLHVRDMPGSPDIVLPKYGAVVQANGCFWHGHDCSLFRMPATNREKWTEKITRNRDRDQANRQLLAKAGWRVMDVWECAIRGPGRIESEEMIEKVCEWIEDDSQSAELRSAEVPV